MTNKKDEISSESFLLAISTKSTVNQGLGRCEITHTATQV